MVIYYPATSGYNSVAFNSNRGQARSSRWVCNVYASPDVDRKVCSGEGDGIADQPDWRVLTAHDAGY